MEDVLAVEQADDFPFYEGFQTNRAIFVCLADLHLLDPF